MSYFWKNFGVLSIFCVCLGAFAIVSSLVYLIRELKRVSGPLAAEQQKFQWYKNANFRNYGESLLDGLYLILFIAMLGKSDTLLGILLALYFCLKATFMLIGEREHRAAAKGAGKELNGWISNPRLHQQLATTIFWLGLCVMMLQSEKSSIIIGFTGVSLTLIGVGYWITIYTIFRIN